MSPRDVEGSGTMVMAGVVVVSLGQELAGNGGDERQEGHRAKQRTTARTRPGHVRPERTSRPIHRSSLRTVHCPCLSATSRCALHGPALYPHLFPHPLRLPCPPSSASRVLSPAFTASPTSRPSHGTRAPSDAHTATAGTITMRRGKLYRTSLQCMTRT